MKAEDFVKEFQKRREELEFQALVLEIDFIVNFDDVEIVGDRLYFFNYDFEDKTLIMDVGIEEFENKIIRFMDEEDYFSIGIRKPREANNG